MSRDEVEGLNELYLELLESDLPDPELLARYAQAPNELSAAERLQVERAMERSPLVVDELDTLRGFDFGQLDADLTEAGTRRAGLWQGFLQRPTVWAGLMAAAAVLIWFVIGRESPVDRLDGADRAPEQIAHEPARSESTAPADPLEPIDRSGSEQRDDSMLAETRPPAIERPDSLAANEEDELGAPQNEDALPEPAARNPEILIAMVMPRYESPIDAAIRTAEPSAYRSSGDPNLNIRTLTPNHVAWTRFSQPALHWSVDQMPDRGAFYFSMMDADDDVIADNVALEKVVRTGIQSISLEDLEIRLPGNVEIRWSVAHRLEEEAPPTEYAFGWIRVVGIAPELREKVNSAEPSELPDVLARAGYWYDSLEAILELESKFPDDDAPREALRSLLEQAGRPAIAD
jgi:hypothetical protein